jgi:hypothetical protein
MLRGGRILIALLSIIGLGLGLRLAAPRFASPFLVDGWLGVQIDCLAGGTLVAWAFATQNREIVRPWTSAAFVLGVAALAIIVGSMGPGPSGHRWSGARPGMGRLSSPQWPVRSPV